MAANFIDERSGMLCCNNNHHLAFECMHRALSLLCYKCLNLSVQCTFIARQSQTIINTAQMLLWCVIQCIFHCSSLRDSIRLVWLCMPPCAWEYGVRGRVSKQCIKCAATAVQNVFAEASHL